MHNANNCYCFWVYFPLHISSRPLLKDTYEGGRSRGPPSFLSIATGNIVLTQNLTVSDELLADTEIPFDSHQTKTLLRQVPIREEKYTGQQSFLYWRLTVKSGHTCLWSITYIWWDHIVIRFEVLDKTDGKLLHTTVSLYLLKLFKYMFFMPNHPLL